MKKHDRNPIITPDVVVPSHEQLIVKGALNPGATWVDDEIVLLLRIAEGSAKTPGMISVPVARFENGKREVEILEWEEDDPKIGIKDNRSVVYGGQEYVTTLSHLRVARSKNGVDFTIEKTPFLLPRNASEEFGVEDARITKIDDVYYINYTAVSRDSYGTSLVRTRDFSEIEYLGMIFTVPNKDVCIFPEKIDGKYYALHRPFNHDFGKSSIWIAESEDLLHWGNHKCLIRPQVTKWESEKIGGGAPPIKTERGWLEIYHGKSLRKGQEFYSLMVLLLDLEDPTRVVYRSKTPIMIPEEKYETRGFVPNVVFLNGAVQKSPGELLLYYSACDESTCLAECTVDELISF